VEDASADVHVPALCDVEVVSALRRLVLKRRISLERAREALGSYLELPLERESHEALLSRVLDLRNNFGAFDAVYAALAESQDATLVTADDRLARAVREHLSLTLIEA
jgi:predicted nucleic acid-binding protein